MLIDRNNINEIVQKTGIKPDKDYGQNFLIDTNISETIVNSLNVQKNETTLEIGPGLGSLTHFLDGKTNLTVVDIDSRMTQFISYNYKDIEIINNDIRKVDVSNFDKIIGNLPYNITTELVIYLLCNSKRCKKMVLMCQQEAYSRFFDLTGESYGPASVLVHLLGDIKQILVAKPGAFYPSPKCNSLVFEFSLSNELDRNHAIKVYKMTKALFLSRRKTILNNLKNYLNNNQLANDILKELGVETNKRPEEISPYIFLKMYNLIEEKKNR